MEKLNEATQKLVFKYQNWYEQLQFKEGQININVDEVVSRVASFYEKMREVIDWREEHLLRRTAIERIFKRRLFLKKNGENVAAPLVFELIRGGHFPNNSIPEAKIVKVQKLIDKYVFILENAPAAPKEKIRLYDWLLGIAACEIEEILAPSLKEQALLEFMFESLLERIQIKLTEEEKSTQLYIAIQRALFKLDSPIISYHLLKKRYLEWSDLPREKLTELAKNIYSVWDKVEKELKYPFSEKLYKLAEQYDTPYLILGDIIAKNPKDAPKELQDPQILETKIKQAYKERLSKVKARMNRAAIYSTISIFVSKVLVALAVEIPFDKYITQQFSSTTLTLSITIPPLLMFLLILSIRPPSRKNEDLVMMEVMKIAYQKERKDVYEIRPAAKRGFILNSIVLIFYLLGFFISFGLIVWALEKLNFSLVSIAIFLIFFSLISFAGVKIRQRAKELVIEKEKESFLCTLSDLFSLPIIQVGRWLSNQWTKYNALVILFNFLLDMPFQVFIEFLEQWRQFLREKKEKIF